MALIDDIEKYGQAVDSGEMTTEQAIAGLIDAHAAIDIRLPETGAADLIANWKAARGQYEQGLNQSFHFLAAIENGRRPHPSSKPKEQ